MSDKPKALVTNDDGIGSFFLHRLVEALMNDGFDVTVAAPTYEQSWVGRALTRRKEIHVLPAPDFPHDCRAWMLDGTPSDCVNIALGGLIGELPDVVVAGINLGFNTTEMLILSSGTVAAAIEGALWGIPSIAFSKCIPEDLFETVQESKGHDLGVLTNSLSVASGLAAKMTHDLIASPEEPGKVVNVNFPIETLPDTPVEETVPAKAVIGSLFEHVGKGVFQFRYTEGLTRDFAGNSDRACLIRGNISRSVLDFGAIGQRELGAATE